MITSTSKAQAMRVWCDDENLWVQLTDGRQLATPLSYFPRLANADKEARNRFELSGGGSGIHWENLDEDISVQGLLAGIGDLTKNRS